MMLSRGDIARIEGLLEKGFTVELRIEEGDPIPKPGGGTRPRPRQVTIFKRPDSDDIIRIPPTLVNEAHPEMLRLVIATGSDYQTELASVEVPAGFWVSGIQGHQGISQEIEEEGG
jgi:hypothetical protein